MGGGVGKKDRSKEEIRRLEADLEEARKEIGRLARALDSTGEIVDEERSRARERYAQLEHIVNASPAMAFLWRNAPGWPVEFVSDNVRQLGYSPEDLTSGAISFADMVHPDDRERVAAEVEGHAESGAVEFTQEYRVVTGSGQVRWLDDRTWVRRDAGGEITHFQGVVLDITEQRRIEAALKASEEKYRTLVDNAGEAILVAQGERFVFANPKALEITGYDSEEILALPIHRFIHPDDREMVMDRYLRRLRGEEVASSYEFRAMHEGGEARWIGIHAVAVEWEGAPATLNFLRDVTTRRRLEEQLRQAQKMESIGRLAGGVAHDFNNLLSPMIVHSEMLLADMRRGDPLREDVEQIREAAERAKVLTRQLLAFGRKQLLAIKVLDLKAVVAGFEPMLRSALREDIELRLGLGTGTLAFRGDLSQIEQVLMNLAVNSQDAMPDGGAIEVRTDEIEVGAEGAEGGPDVRPGYYATLVLADTGCGMDEETAARAFDPFFTTKGRGRGSGLGLSTVYGIVKQHGGDVAVSSEPGRGTEVRILLPRSNEPPAATETRSSTPPFVGFGETILVVEDDPAVRSMTRRLLGRLGYEVLAAEDGPAALRVSKEHPGKIHLLLTDVVMPAMNGRDLYTRLVSSRTDLEVVYMSGYTDDAIARHGVLEPGTAFVQKPFTTKELAAKVREVLSG